jgi:DNA-binding MarR family transcriptional regulator
MIYCCLVNISIPVHKIPLGFSATELSKRFGVSQQAVSVAVKQGEKIAQTERLESEENYKAIILWASCKFPVSGSDL